MMIGEAPQFIITSAGGEELSLRCTLETEGLMTRVSVHLRLHGCSVQVVGGLFMHHFLEFEAALKEMVVTLEGSATLTLLTVTINVIVDKKGMFEWRVSFDQIYLAVFEASGSRSWSLDVTLINDQSYLGNINKQLNALRNAITDSYGEKQI